MPSLSSFLLKNTPSYLSYNQVNVTVLFCFVFCVYFFSLFVCHPLDYLIHQLNFSILYIAKCFIHFIATKQNCFFSIVWSWCASCNLLSYYSVVFLLFLPFVFSLYQQQINSYQIFCGSICFVLRNNKHKKSHNLDVKFERLTSDFI